MSGPRPLVGLHPANCDCHQWRKPYGPFPDIKRMRHVSCHANRALLIPHGKWVKLGRPKCIEAARHSTILEAENRAHSLFRPYKPSTDLDVDLLEERLKIFDITHKPTLGGASNE